MHADWSVECAADDPVVVVPWSSDDLPSDDSSKESQSTPAAYIDLRLNPSLIESIPDASLHPALAAALRHLNRAESSVFTAKCDAWLLDPDELESLSWHLPGIPTEAGFACYIDLLRRSPGSFASFVFCEKWLRRLALAASIAAHTTASADFILRPARVLTIDSGAYEDGFAVTLYAYGYGHDAVSAYSAWESALQSLSKLVE